MKKRIISLGLVLCLLCTLFSGCSLDDSVPGGDFGAFVQEIWHGIRYELGGLFDKETKDEKISLDDIPAYTSSPSVAINGNQPFFTEKDMTEEAFETYSELDRLGRCGVAYANICKELMPTEDRGSISNVHPSGWVSARYDTSLVEGGYLYNRSHLIGFQLAGENANEKNLITGTRYFNVTGMLPFEDMVADYIKEEEDNHVLYRVTPIYDGDNLVASGVLMEAYSVEDDGQGVCYCVYVYNVQPGIEINYATGESKLAD